MTEAHNDDGTMSDDLMNRVKRERALLSPSLKAIAEFILVEGTGVEELSITRLAQLTYTSKPTVVRFAQHFGFDGWRDFKAEFVSCAERSEASHTREALVNVNYPFGPEASPEEIVEGVRAVRIAALDDTTAGMDLGQLMTAAQRVLSSRQVVFLGRQPNSSLGEVFAFNVRNLGVDCRVPHEEEVSQVVRFLGEGDSVIASSYSGTVNWGPMRYVDAARRQGVFVIGITTIHSPLGERSNCLLAYEAAEHYYTKVAGFYGTECVSFILDALFAACYSLRYGENTRARGILADELANHYSLPDSL